MGLPSNPRASEGVTLGDITIDVVGLQLFQVRQLAAMDQDISDATAIAWATGCSVDEATEWIEKSPAGDTVALLAAIMRMSGWEPDAGKRFPA